VSKKKKDVIKDPWEEIKTLQKKVDELTDENASLWFLLDELDRSDIHTEENQETLRDAFERLQEATLMMHRKTEEA
jgi:hypothetical protein